MYDSSLESRITGLKHTQGGYWSWNSRKVWNQYGFCLTWKKVWKRYGISMIFEGHGISEISHGKCEKTWKKPEKSWNPV